MSMAERAELPVATETGELLTVTPDIPSNQNEGVCVGIVINSMSPVYNVSFVPPSVNTPPKVWAAALVLFNSLVSQKDISGEVRALLEARLYQNGLACVLASAVHAKPMIPETAPSIRLEVSCDTAKRV